MKLTNIALSVSTIIVLAFGQQVAFSQKRGDVKEMVINITRKTSTFFKVLGEISSKNNVKIGVQASEKEEPEGCRQPINLKQSNFVLKDLMEILVSECPMYDWSVDGDVVNVFPKENEASLLDSKVNKLKVKDKL